MFNVIPIVLILVINLVYSALGHNATNFQKCLFAYSVGSSHQTFYDVSKAVLPDSNGIDFHFAVQGAENAHILFSNTLRIADTRTPAYEILLGGWGNTVAAIRRTSKGSEVAKVSAQKIISAERNQAFWIYIGKDGVIEVGREGSPYPFLTWTDTNPIKDLKYFSFSSWDSVELKWFFDC